MAINKKFIHAKTLAEFQKELSAGHILDESIVFIKDVQKIWTHGQYYSITDAPSDGDVYARRNGAWEKITTSESLVEQIEVSLVSNKSLTDPYLIGAEVTLTYGEQSDTKIWNGTAITFNVLGNITYSLSVSKVGEYYTPASKSYTAGIGTLRQVQFVYQVGLDLSMLDIYGNSRNSATTANCYVVKESGTYIIPLVYGNAIVNGSTNSASYTKASGSYSLDFVNGKGTIINTPFIEKQVTISSAQLSIADTDGIFTNISVSSNPNVTDISNCGYVQFKVTSVPSTGANGVISIKNSSGTIIWNWHIWIWADSLTPVSITNGSGVPYKILPYNLASKWDTGKAKIKNWYYQWGRSVPMLCPSVYNSTANHASFGKLGFTTAPVASTYNQGIANPTTFYCNSNSPYNWFGSTSYYNLWDANCTTSGASDNVTVKTVYDPCPPGFKIPNGNTFTGFSTSNGGSFNNGYTWSGSFFPAAGSRSLGDGSLLSVGLHGFVWTSASQSQHYAHSLNLSSGNVNTHNTNFRAFGFSVRPVAES